MSVPPVINTAQKLAQFSDHWNPRVVASYNGNDVRLSKLEGEFTWHSHAETDELFFVLEGELRIRFRDGERTIGAGEMLVVPKGVEHLPIADKECHVMVMDREGEPNTGDTASRFTKTKLEKL